MAIINRLAATLRTLLQKRLVLLGLVLLCGLWGAKRPLTMVARTGPASPSVDLDCGILYDEAARTPNLRATGKWWSGTWQPEARYFRPLTITLFWIQYKLFGEKGLPGFTLVHIASHLLMLAIAFFFFCELLGPAPAALGVAFYGAHFAKVFTLPSAESALVYWKDSCDAWCASAILLTLWAFTRYLTSNRWPWLMTSLLLFVLAICIKEGAYQVPFMVILLLWFKSKLRSHWWAALPFFGVAAACWKYRTWALGGTPARTGANRMWPMRWANGAAGLRGGMVTRDFLPLAMIAMIVASCQVAIQRWGLAACNIALSLACLILTSWLLEKTVEETAIRVLINEPWAKLPYAIATVWFYWRLFTRRERGQIYAYLFIAIAFIPLSVQPPTSDHAEYFVALGWGLFLAYVVIDLWELAVTGYRERGAALRNFFRLKPA